MRRRPTLVADIRRSGGETPEGGGGGGEADAPVLVGHSPTKKRTMTPTLQMQKVFGRHCQPNLTQPHPDTRDQVTKPPGHAMSKASLIMATITLNPFAGHLRQPTTARPTRR